MMIHLCRSQGDTCMCFPSAEFLIREDVQRMLNRHQLQEVFDLWNKEVSDGISTSLDSSSAS